MASTATTNIISHCPKLLQHFPNNKHSLSLNKPTLPFSSSHHPCPLPSLRLNSRKVALLQSRRFFRVAAASAAGSFGNDGFYDNPYEFLGVKPDDGFVVIKETYTRKRLDAERGGDKATVDLLEKAYDFIMMEQLAKRREGSVQVSKEIKYADKLPLLPWGPRFCKSEVRDVKVNAALSAGFIAWSFIQRSAQWKPLQFLSLLFIHRLFEKLKAFEPAESANTTEYEDNLMGLRMGKRLLRSFVLVFGCIGLTFLAFSVSYDYLLPYAMKYYPRFIPAALFESQELFVTAASAVLLFFLASFYR